MNEEEIRNVIRDEIKKINQENEDIEQQQENSQREHDRKLKRDVILNSYMNTGQEIDKIIISLSSGAIGVFAINDTLRNEKVLFMLGLSAFLLSIFASVFALILNKKDLHDRWNNQCSIGLVFFTNILVNCGIWLFIIGVLMITIILFII